MVMQLKNLSFPCWFAITGLVKTSCQLLASCLSSSGRKFGNLLLLGVFVGILLVAMIGGGVAMEMSPQQHSILVLIFLYSKGY
jgi:hypothetical protein